MQRRIIAFARQLLVTSKVGWFPHRRLLYLRKKKYLSVGSDCYQHQVAICKKFWCHVAFFVKDPDPAAILHLLSTFKS